jgi:hypothetical protein
MFHYDAGAGNMCVGAGQGCAVMRSPFIIPRYSESFVNRRLNQAFDPAFATVFVAKAAAAETTHVIAINAAHGM